MSTLLKQMQDNYAVHILKNETGKYVHIHEMVHIAPKEFYEWKNQQFQEEVNAGFTLHHEGVQNSKLQDLGEAYQGIAKLIGWEAQTKPNLPFSNYDITWEEMNWFEKKFMKTIAKSLGWLTRMLVQSNQEPSDKNQQSMEDIKKNIIEGSTQGSHVLSVFKPFLIHKRNEIAMRHLLEDSQSVSLIWGKAHAPDFIQRLEKHGYKLLTTG